MKKYIVIDKRTSHIEYEIIVEQVKDKKVFKLIYGSQFAERLIGKTALSATDDENQIVFNPPVGKQLQYHKFSEFRILSSFINQFDKNLDSEYQYICVDNLKDL